MRKKYRQCSDGTYRGLATYKDANGLWKQKTKGGFETAKKAEIWAEEKEREMLNLIDQNITPTNATITDVFEIYIDELIDIESAENTVNLYKRTMAFFTELTTPINKLTPFEIKKYIQTKSKETGYNYKNYLTKLSNVFNFVIRDLKWLKENPAKGIRLKQREDKRIKFIDKNLFEKILDSIKNERFKCLSKLLYHTGLRLSEALGLTIYDVHHDHINVNKQMNSRGEMVKLKTKNSYREVPISIEIYRMLKNMPIDIRGAFFRPSDGDTLRFHLAHFNTSPHILRHTRTTVLISEGIDPTYISKIIGDKIETIMSTYIEYNTEKEKEMQEKVRAII